MFKQVCLRIVFLLFICRHHICHQIFCIHDSLDFWFSLSQYYPFFSFPFTTDLQWCVYCVKAVLAWCIGNKTPISDKEAYWLSFVHVGIEALFAVHLHIIHFIQNETEICWPYPDDPVMCWAKLYIHMSNFPILATIV